MSNNRNPEAGGMQVEMAAQTPEQEFRTLLDWVLLSCKQIDDAIPLNQEWPLPSWFVAMSHLQATARVCKRAITKEHA